MLDQRVLRAVAPLLNAAAGVLVRNGVRADTVTWIGFGFGMAGATAIALQAYTVGLALAAIRTLCDGLDGSVARLTAPTDRGAYLDITLDFLFYASVPLAFACADPASNAFAAAVLLAGFMGTGTTFLAVAALVERRGLRSPAHPGKGIYYLTGLTEGTETLVLFAAMCLWPGHFAAIALLFAALCLITVIGRVSAGIQLLS